MAVLSGVAYKEPKDANKTFEKYGFHNHRFIDKDGAQCYVIWNDISAIICFRGTEPKEMSDIKADLNALQRQGLQIFKIEISILLGIHLVVQWQLSVQKDYKKRV